MVAEHGGRMCPRLFVAAQSRRLASGISFAHAIADRERRVVAPTFCTASPGKECAMSASSQLKLAILAAGLLALTVGYSAAQYTPGQPNQPTTPARPAETSQPAAQSQSADVDRFLASCLAAKNQAEIEISQFAQERSQDPQVKQFAQEVIAEHRELSQKLQQIAGVPRMAQQPGRTAQQPDRNDRPGMDPSQPGNMAGQPRRTADTPDRQSSAVDQLIAIEKQITDRAADSFREKLQTEPAGKFDECYLSAQIASHMQLAAALDVIQSRTSGQLRQIAGEAKPTIERHLEKAEQLLAQKTGAANRRVGLEGSPAGLPDRIR
jgi:predicted outer membrane protein